MVSGLRQPIHKVIVRQVLAVLPGSCTFEPTKGLGTRPLLPRPVPIQEKEAISSAILLIDDPAESGHLALTRRRRGLFPSLLDRPASTTMEPCSCSNAFCLVMARNDGVE